MPCQGFLSDIEGRERIVPKGWTCYLLECADQSYYVGVAIDVGDHLSA